jgi:hypothetical protein
VLGAEEQGETGSDMVPLAPKLALLVLIIIMLRLIGTSSFTGSDRAPEELAEKELYFRSLPKPVSGVGPANVSSQSLSRNPIIIMLLLKHKLRFFFE